MTNWLSGMQQTFEFYVVDPVSWRDKQKLDNVESCSIKRDSSQQTLGSASFTLSEVLPECYVRVYMIAIQNGRRDRVCLGTYMVQTPSVAFDGRRQSISMDGYTTLLELKDNMPQLGYYVPKKSNTMKTAYQLMRDHMRAPVMFVEHDHEVFYDYTAEPDETWLDYISGLITMADYDFALEPTGEVLFSPIETVNKMQAVWTYDDDNTTSILYPDVTIDRDMFEIPNVVEIVYSEGGTKTPMVSIIKNTDPNSPTSIQARGREIYRRVTDPSVSGVATQEQLDLYAKKYLKEASTLEYTVSYKHGYCPVRLGDCVRLNYKRGGLDNVKAKVISQSISCVPGCPVEEVAVYTQELWNEHSISMEEMSGDTE